MQKGAEKGPEKGRKEATLFGPLMLAQSHTRPAAVLVDEFDTRCRVNPFGFVSSIAASPRCGFGGKTKEARAKLGSLFSCPALGALLA